MKGSRIAIAAGLLAAVFLAASGCGYRLAGRGGSTSFLPPGVRTIGIPPLRNETERPELELRATEQLIEEFVRRSRYEATPGQAGADVFLEGAITSYRIDPVTFTASGRYSRVEVTITAKMRLVLASPEKVLWSQSHFVFREQYDVPGAALQQFDREIVAIDEIARGFARSVVTSILEGF